LKSCRETKRKQVPASSVIIALSCEQRSWKLKHVVLAVLITCLAVGTAAAQSCDSQAVSANGKPLHGAAKMSFVKKCKRDACANKAVSAEGKPLHGAAKNSFMKKCMRTA
jgi:hypothetical protein